MRAWLQDRAIRTDFGSISETSDNARPNQKLFPMKHIHAQRIGIGQSPTHSFFCVKRRSWACMNVCKLLAGMRATQKSQMPRGLWALRIRPILVMKTALENLIGTQPKSTPRNSTFLRNGFLMAKLQKPRTNSTLLLAKFQSVTRRSFSPNHGKLVSSNVSYNACVTLAP